MVEDEDARLAPNNNNPYLPPPPVPVYQPSQVPVRANV